jgi:hypothetical protein
MSIHPFVFGLSLWESGLALIAVITKQSLIDVNCYVLSALVGGTIVFLLFGLAAAIAGDHMHFCLFHSSRQQDVPALFLFAGSSLWTYLVYRFTVALYDWMACWRIWIF